MAERLQTLAGGQRNPWLRAPALVSSGFLAAIVLGTLLLGMPGAVAEEHPPLSLVQALFTATSAVCVTGLTVVETGTELSGFGQAVVLVLIQLGGLGVMTLAFLVFGRLRSRMQKEAGEVLESSWGQAVWGGSPARTLRLVLGGTLLLETLGAAALWIALREEDGAFGKAVFLSISAFCNAGFDTLGGALGGRYSGDWAVGLPLLLLWLLGGLGFLLPAALEARRRRGGRLALTARMILIASAVLVPAGALLFWLCERDGLLAGRRPSETLLLALFQGNTPRTAGFSMVDLAAASRLTLLTLVPLMLVGGSPGSTAGGMKTVTVWVFLATIWTRMQGKDDVVILRSTIPAEIVRRAYLICVLMILLLALTSWSLAALVPPEQASLEQLVFEAASALGTVGLGTGLTPELGAAPLLVLVCAMLLGRLGPLTAAYALFSRPTGPHIYHPQSEVYVG